MANPCSGHRTTTDHLRTDSSKCFARPHVLPAIRASHLGGCCAHAMHAVHAVHAMRCGAQLPTRSPRSTRWARQRARLVVTFIGKLPTRPGTDGGGHHPRRNYRHVNSVVDQHNRGSR
jgi:hypothetical protein